MMRSIACCIGSNPTPLWCEAELLLERTCGLVIIDDTTLNTPYARTIGLAQRHWSGNHRCVVDGINLVTLVWRDTEYGATSDLLMTMQRWTTTARQK